MGHFALFLVGLWDFLGYARFDIIHCSAVPEADGGYTRERSEDNVRYR